MARILIELSGDTTIRDLYRFTMIVKEATSTMNHPIHISDDPNDTGTSIYVIIETEAE